MARKKKTPPAAEKIRGVIAGAGEVQQQQITETLEENYMPYAMSVILSRAIPEIDGFKPSHRKLLFTMYQMGLLGGTRTKSANIVGQTMKLNPHGDSAIYDTMVRLSRGYEALLHPYVDSKGNFGKFYSRDMAYAASRYTEAKLSSLCKELFRDIDKDTVDFVDNYDSTMQEPTLLPATFPSVLVNANTGIAVGMASSICPFHLGEVCDTTIARLKKKDSNVADTLLAPDFPGGGQLLYDKDALQKIYETGRGSFRVRAKYQYDKSANCIDILQIPPTTTVEAIVEKVVDLAKGGKLKEISDIRDETGLQGLKITLDLKRGIDPDKLMQKLFRLTTLEDSFSCNFNVLIDGTPQVLGVGKLLDAWIAFRERCIRRRTQYTLTKRQEKLHLLKGLATILLDIDKAVAIVRNTEEEAEVVPNLMAGFSIDAIQAEYVAEIRLRHLNREYILKRTEEISALEAEIEELQSILESDKKIRGIMIEELKQVKKAYDQPRKTVLLYPEELEDLEEAETVPDYPVHLFLTQEGYFKKITPQSLRMSGEHKLKVNDQIVMQVDSSNTAELLFFTDKATVYKTRAYEFGDSKTSVLGDYVPAKLQMEEGERVLSMVVTKDYSGFLLFCYENGKVAKVPLRAYQTKTNRKKLLSAYSDKSPLVSVLQYNENGEALLQSSAGRLLLLKTEEVPEKATRSTAGVQAFTLKKNQTVTEAVVYAEGMLQTPTRYRKHLPSTGALPSEKDQMGEQLAFGEIGK